MLLVLKKGSRIKAAIAATLLYAVCVLAPSAALAFADPGATAHCLSDSQGAAHVHRDTAQAAPHVHADNTEHAHADTLGAPNSSHTDGKARNSTCCGLFCISALASEAAAALLAAPASALHGPALTFHIDGREPGRIHRPPIG